MLSVIIPAYNEEQMLPIAAETISRILTEAEIDCELIFVDDGSQDKTWVEIERASKQYGNVRGVHFSRNFGKEAAIMAGLGQAEGGCSVVMDCDLQHPPETIIEMYRLWERGFEIVEGLKKSRGRESVLHRFAAHSFYSIISSAVGFNMESSSDFKLLDRKAVDVLLRLQEKNAFFRAMSSWIGFKTTTVYFEVQERVAGKSKWSTTALTKYAVHNIASFSSAPMQFVTILGVIMLIVSAILGSLSLYKKICGLSLDGFTTVIILQLFSSSVVMLSVGIIGYYIARIFEEVKGRPLYIISDTCGRSIDSITGKDLRA